MRLRKPSFRPLMEELQSRVTPTAGLNDPALAEPAWDDHAPATFETCAIVAPDLVFGAEQCYELSWEGWDGESEFLPWDGETWEFASHDGTEVSWEVWITGFSEEQIESEWFTTFEWHDDTAWSEDYWQSNEFWWLDEFPGETSSSVDFGGAWTADRGDGLPWVGDATIESSNTRDLVFVNWREDQLQLTSFGIVENASPPTTLAATSMPRPIVVVGSSGPAVDRALLMMNLRDSSALTDIGPTTRNVTVDSPVHAETRVSPMDHARTPTDGATTDSTAKDTDAMAGLTSLTSAEKLEPTDEGFGALSIRLI